MSVEANLKWVYDPKDVENIEGERMRQAHKLAVNQIQQSRYDSCLLAANRIADNHLCRYNQFTNVHLPLTSVCKLVFACTSLLFSPLSCSAASKNIALIVFTSSKPEHSTSEPLLPTTAKSRMRARELSGSPHTSAILLGGRESYSLAITIRYTISGLYWPNKANNQSKHPTHLTVISSAILTPYKLYAAPFIRTPVIPSKRYFQPASSVR